MSTEESSPQLAALSDEPASPLEPVPNVGLQPPSTLEMRAWLDVAKGVAVWLASVAFLLFLPVVIAIPYIIYRAITVGVNLQQLATDKTLFFLSVLGVFPAHLLTLVVTWMLVSEGGRYPFWKNVGFVWPKMGPVTSSLLSFLIALVLLLLAWAATTYFGGGKTDLDLIVESSIYARFAIAIVAVVGAPLVEELIYRGVLYPAIERVSGVIPAIMIVSLLFAGVHVAQYRNNIAVILIITVLSFTLTTARAVTGSLIPSFLIHLIFNGIQSIVLALSPFIEKNADKTDQAVPAATPGLEFSYHLIERIITAFHVF